jgi:RHS repeat-associated protein
MGRTKDGYTRGSAFRYGINRQRVVHYEFDSVVSGEPSNLTDKKIYVTPGMEVDYKNNASTWDLDTVRIYIPAPGGNAGAVELDPNATTSSQHDLHVYHYDNLGSIQAVTDYGETDTNWSTLFFNDVSGKELLYSYDPFGSRRDPGDWKHAAKTQSTYTWGWDDPATPALNEDDPLTRGYTGHEMLDDLGLVHMNGRIYDPLIGRFLSGDILVQFPNKLQSYNRYSYVLNNPLKYSDPTGYEVTQDAVIGFDNFLDNVQKWESLNSEKFEGVSLSSRLESFNSELKTMLI